MPRKGIPLTETHPALALQAHGWDPSAVSAGSGKKVEWKCLAGHLFEALVSNRAKGSGCPFCANYRVLTGFNDLRTRYPEVASEAYGWDPGLVLPGSEALKSWRCAANHFWEATPKSRTRGVRCPYCSNRKLLPGFNDIASVSPKIAAEALGWDPSAVSIRSNEKLPWRCSLGHEWKHSPSERLAGRSCPYCSGQRVSPGSNDLLTKRPDLASQADGWDPSTVTSRSGKKVPWICDKGHRWVASVIQRTKSHGSGCPYCAGLIAIVGVNDLETKLPEIAREADGWDPSTVLTHSGVIRNWRCPQGHHYRATVQSRSKGDGCPFCSNHKVLVGFNDLATTRPDIALRAHGWDPTTVTAGSEKKRRWKCEQGHEWTATVASQRGSGCPACAKFGYDPNKDAWLYLLTHEEFGLSQIGITNSPKDRLANHARRGWTTIDIRGPVKGELARIWEADILKVLRSKSVDVGTPLAGRFDGYSEAWPTRQAAIFTIRELLEMTRSAADHN